jgi:hypothetical protein
MLTALRTLSRVCGRFIASIHQKSICIFTFAVLLFSGESARLRLTRDAPGALTPRMRACCPHCAPASLTCGFAMRRALGCAASAARARTARGLAARVMAEAGEGACSAERRVSPSDAAARSALSRRRRLNLQRYSAPAACCPPSAAGWTAPPRGAVRQRRTALRAASCRSAHPLGLPRRKRRPDRHARERDRHGDEHHLWPHGAPPSPSAPW